MTTIADQQGFNKAHKRQRQYKACPPDLIDKYRGRLPDLLIDTWAAFGFQEFSDGFLWSVNPDEFRDIVRDFLYDFQVELVDVIFRTAFGDMIISYQGKLIHFSAVMMRHDTLPDNLGAVLELHLALPQSLKAIFFFDLFKKALKKLGAPSEDEVYAFAPAPMLGGDISVDNLSKGNLRTYLHFLSQLQSSR